MSLSEILQDLPRLTEAERQELREVLDSYDPERERAWAQLAKERFRAIKAGERKTVDGRAAERFVQAVDPAIAQIHGDPERFRES